MNILVILRQKNEKWQYCMAATHIGMALSQYHLIAFGMLCMKYTRKRKTLPIKINLHPASFIFTKAMIIASGIIITSAESGVIIKSTVSSTSTGKRMTNRMR